MKNYYELKTDNEYKFWEYELKGKNFKMKWGLVEDYFDRSEIQSKTTKYDSPEHGIERVSLMVQRYEKKGYVATTKPEKTQPKNVNVNTSGETKFNASVLKNTLQLLDKLLQEKRPEYFTHLNIPLSLDQISVLEKKYSTLLPEDIKLLYQWKNGQSTACNEAFINNAMFEPLEEVLDTNKEFTGMVGHDFKDEKWWNKHWLPLFHNGGGDYICCNIESTEVHKKGQVINFWHDEKDRETIWENVTSLLTDLSTYYSAIETNKIDEFIDVTEYLDSKK